MIERLFMHILKELCTPSEKQRMNPSSDVIWNFRLVDYQF